MCSTLRSPPRWCLFSSAGPGDDLIFRQQPPGYWFDVTKFPFPWRGLNQISLVALQGAPSGRKRGRFLRRRFRRSLHISFPEEGGRLFFLITRPSMYLSTPPAVTVPSARVRALMPGNIFSSFFSPDLSGCRAALFFSSLPDTPSSVFSTLS